MEKLNVLVTAEPVLSARIWWTHLSNADIASEYSIRSFRRFTKTASPEHLNPAAEFIQGDVCDAASSCRQALEGIEWSFMKLPKSASGQSMYEIDRYVRANDLGTAVLLENVIKRRDQIKKLIVASSMSIYGEGAYRCADLRRWFIRNCATINNCSNALGDGMSQRARLRLTPAGTSEDKPLFPTSVYAITKQDQEQFCLVVGRAYGIPTVALRYFNVYGPRQALSNPYTGVCAIFSSRLLNDQPPMIFEDGEQTRDFVHVSDIVQANLLALETDRANYLAGQCRNRSCDFHSRSHGFAFDWFGQEFGAGDCRQVSRGRHSPLRRGHLARPRTCWVMSRASLSSREFRNC